MKDLGNSSYQLEPDESIVDNDSPHKVISYPETIRIIAQGNGWLRIYGDKFIIDVKGNNANDLGYPIKNNDF